MSQIRPELMYGNSKAYRENWTAGGFVVMLLALAAFIALMAVPALVTGMVLGVVALKVGERLVSRHRAGWTRGFGDSQVADYLAA